MLWSDSLSRTWKIFFFAVLYIQAKLLVWLCVKTTWNSDISMWFVTSIAKFKKRWAAVENEVMFPLTSSHPEHQYLSAKCLKCKCERWNKKRLRLCSSAVHAELWLWIIHVSLQTEKFEKTDKVEGYIFSPFSYIISLWFWFVQSFNFSCTKP